MKPAIMYAVYKKDSKYPRFIVASAHKWWIRGEFSKAKGYRIERIEVNIKHAAAWDIYKHEYKRIKT